MRACKRLRYSLKFTNPHIIFLMETKLDYNRVEKVRRSYGYVNNIDVLVDSSRGGLSLA